MRIEAASPAHLTRIAELAQRRYLRERERSPLLPMLARSGWANVLAPLLETRNGLACMEGDALCGYLLPEPGTDCVCSPWGCGAESEKALSQLFTELARPLVAARSTRFQIKLYAHDEAALRLFSFLQFGVECEEGLRATDEPIQGRASVPVREWPRAESRRRWPEVWAMLHAVVRHLQQSPVFYPGEEFTEELYRSYVLSPDTRLFVAEPNDAPAGMILAAPADDRPPLQGAWGVGEAYVMPARRGTGMAQALLGYANDALRQEGVRRLWVEHGTANPNARGFWNKYFHTFSYSLLRSIDPVR